jgi:tetratricopeptide (TPR) repeat protein
MLNTSSDPRTAWLKPCTLGVAFLFGLGLVLSVQQELDRRFDVSMVQVERLAQLPSGEHLKPALLGYHHLAADVLWLRFVQVLGKKRNTADEYEWMYHALDVITTLDSRYAYAYQVGGIVLTELAHRVDLSNRILEKGVEANPDLWWLPFNLGYNYYFHLRDPGRAAEYIARAARLPGGPAYLPGLATRMYAEANNPDVALDFLSAMWRQADNASVKAELETRMKELTIERDIGLLESAVTRYRQRYGVFPARLVDLVQGGELTRLPTEPFGGEYRLDSKKGTVTSSTHPKRLHVFGPDELVSPPGWGGGT